MGNTEEKFNKRRIRSSYTSVVVSISLVLTLVGLISIVALRAKHLEVKTKEGYKFKVVLKNEANDNSIRQFMKELDVAPYVKQTTFVSKEEAAEIMKERLDQDFIDFVGYNPMPDAIDINLKAEYVSEEEIENINNELMQNEIVKKLVYNPLFIDTVTKNLNTIITYLGAGSVLLLLIAIALINSSIRLTIYSKRFLIKTMQLVGATRGFIQKPFIMNSLKLGLTGSVISIALVMSMVYLVQPKLSEFISFQDVTTLSIAAAIMLGFGLLISWISTWISVNKYLNLNTDEIHF